ncbi:MAG TPA: leucine-rich repeat protein [Methanomassiliicoccales archaeon]|jgi:hypothetical protein
MNHKKLTALLATLMLLSPIVTLTVGSMVGTVSAEVSGSFEYSLNSDGTAVEITRYNGTGTSAVIPSVIAGKPVTSIGERAFSNCTALTAVTIPNSVLTIGAGAFQNCYSLTALTIPNSVSSIGEGAFYDVGLRSVVIPNSMKVIEDNLFFDCYSLTSVTIPVSITSIGDYSFGNCYQLSSIIIPKSVTNIGAGAFSNCGLKTAVIPESVSAIKDRCFQGCYALTSVTIPVSVTSLGNYSFNNCYALSSITIPSNVTSLGDYLFSNCYKLKSAAIMGSVSNIGAGAFSNCYELAAITFYDNAPSMGVGWKTGCGGNLTVSYYQGATGFTDLSWSGVILHQMTSPNAPRNLTAVTGDSRVTLSWKVPSGPLGISTASYLVYQNDICVERVVGTSEKISGLTNGLSYNFTVVLTNTKGNLLNSTSIVVRVPIIGVAVDGTANDIDGNPIANATVTLSNGTVVMTNEYGQFMILGVKAGNYSLTIAKDGYSTITQNVTVTSEKNADLDSVVLQAIDPPASNGSGSGDLTLIIAAVAIAAVIAVYFLFFRKPKASGRRKK